MIRHITIISFLFFLSAGIMYSQEISKLEKLNKKGNDKSFSPESSSDKVTVKDTDGNILLRINDEGNVGSITLPVSTDAPFTVLNKLYNINGILFWDGSALGTSSVAGGWTDIGSIVRLTNLTDRVGIGPSDPLTNLHILGNDGKGTIGCDTLLASADMDGILMICLQALEERTNELRIQNIKIIETNNELVQRIRILETKNKNISTALKSMKQS